MRLSVLTAVFLFAVPAFAASYAGRSYSTPSSSASDRGGFGISVGSSYHFMSGYRGKVWDADLPSVAGTISYQVARDSGFRVGYERASFRCGFCYVSNEMILDRVGLDMIQSFPKLFWKIKPMVLLGVGFYHKKIIEGPGLGSTSDNAVAARIGAGFQIPLSMRSRFQLEGIAAFPRFDDTYTSVYERIGVPDQRGSFFSVGGTLAFVW